MKPSAFLPKSGLLVMVLFWATLSAWPARADITGKITGVVTDAQTGEPLAGGAVQIVELGRGTFTDENGRYFLLNVPVGTYSLKFSLIGYQDFVARRVEVHVDDVTVQDAKLTPEVLKVGEETVVTATRPLVDIRQTGTIQTTDRELILDLPVRSIDDILNFQQGIVRIQSFNQQQPFAEARGIRDVRIRGGRNAEAIFLVDNLPINNPVFGGQGTPFSTRAIGELDFLTGGYPAQYGNALSGVINVVTPEGGDRYHGSLQWGSSRVAGALGSRPNELWRRDQIDLEFNGPIPGLKDLRFVVAGTRVSGAEKVLEFDRIINNPFLPDSAIRAQDPANLPVFFGDVIPGWRALGWDDKQDLFGKLTYNFSPGIKLSGTAQWSSEDINALLSEEADEFAELDLRRFNPPDTVFFGSIFEDVIPPKTRRTTNRQSFFWSHTLGGGKTFYTVSGSRFEQKRNTFIKSQFGQFIDDEFFSDRRGNTFFSSVSLGGLSAKENTTTWAIQSQVTSQLTDHHEIKAGFNYYKYNFDFFESEDLGVNQLSLDTVQFEGDPYEIGAYIQDSIEYDFMTVNLGLRFDVGKTGGSFWVDPFDPYNGTPTDPSDDFADAEARTQLSPRAAISFPVTTTSNVFLNFGRYSQNPLYRNVFINTGIGTPEEGTPKAIDLIFREGSGPRVGNALLEIETTNQYELGFNAGLTEDWSIGATLWAKDNTGLSGIQLVDFFDSEGLYGGGSRRYSVIVNRDFSTSRGLDLRLRRRLSNYWALQATYTFSQARTNSSEPFTQINNELNGDPPDPRRERIDDADQPHNFRLVLDINFPRETYKGLASILNNTRLGWVFRAFSGLPFTPTEDQIGAVQQEVNSGRKPAQYSVDVRGVKEFRIGGVDYAFFVDVRNLLDRKNPIDVFPTTGRPDRGAIDAGRQNEAGDARNLTSTNLDRPWFYGPRREILTGIRLAF